MNADELSKPWPRKLIWRIGHVVRAVLVVLALTSLGQAQKEAGAKTPSPVAATILEAKRETPSDFVRDVMALIDLGEASLAQPLLEELINMELEPAKLVSQFGSAPFLRIARTRELGDTAAIFAQDCLKQATEQANDPQRLAKLVEAMQGEGYPSRVAMRDLQGVGPPAVAFCLAEIASTKEEARKNRLREALVRLEPLSTPALIASLDANDPSVRQQAAWALGQQEAFQAVGRLAALAVLQPLDSADGRAAMWAFSQFSDQPVNSTLVIRLLENRLKDTLGGVPPQRSNSEGVVEVWAWSDDKKTVTRENLPLHEASLLKAARLAELRWRLNPADPEAHRQALALSLQSGLSSPDPSETPTRLLLASLGEAIHQDYPRSAIALCGLLAERGDSRVLTAPDGQPTPLAKALSNRHAGVRFAALEAIMQLAPSRPFPGSSRVSSTLLTFASGVDAATAMVAMPRYIQATTLAGRLTSAGFKTRAVHRGDELASFATDSAHWDFILIDLEILNPGVRETLFRLRRQTTTAATPIGLLASEGRLLKARRLASEHDKVLAFSRPHSAEAVDALGEALLAIAPDPKPTSDERAKQAVQAREWINVILAEGPEYYGLRGKAANLHQAVSQTDDIESSLPTLVLLGTPASQRELLDFANQQSIPVALRQSAAKAFDQSVKRHGVLLTTTEIVQQYDRYNASETDDASTQEVLGSLLDSIELRRSKNPSF